MFPGLHSLDFLGRLAGTIYNFRREWLALVSIEHRALTATYRSLELIKCETNCTMIIMHDHDISDFFVFYLILIILLTFDCLKNMYRTNTELFGVSSRATPSNNGVMQLDFGVTPSSLSCVCAVRVTPS